MCYTMSFFGFDNSNLNSTLLNQKSETSKELQTILIK